VCAKLPAMTIKDRLQKHLGKMVVFTLSVEEEGQPIIRTGRVYGCGNDHVVFIDGIGKLKHVAYAHIAHLQQTWDDENWPTEPN